MWNFFKKTLPDPPKVNYPIPPGGNLGEDEIARIRISVAYHVRMLESGASMPPGFDQRFSLEATMLLVEMLGRLHDEIKGLREDVAWLNPQSQFQTQLGWTSSGKSQDAPSLSPPKVL